jgi:HlyD family secretion protein
VLVVLAVAALAGSLWWARRNGHTSYYTGFVEGEERILRSEVTGRVLEVLYAEGASVPADAVVARLDDADIRSRVASKEREVAVLDADIQTQQERITLVESTWTRDLSAHEADVRQAESAAQLAERTLAREQDLVKTGASTAQLLDDRRAARDQAKSQLDRARQMLGRTQAEERNIGLAKHELESLHERRMLAQAQLAELQVLHAKSEIHAPAVATVVQTQLIWPGELAQPGAGILSVLDPMDKYVQVYVPVADVAGFQVGRKVEIELDSLPGKRVPGEVSFVADAANFTPEKIETRSDRLGQVYRAKVRILEGVERFQPGTEGNVYLVGSAG